MTPLFVLLAVPGCGITGGEPSRLTALAITPRDATVGQNSSIAYHASALNDDGSVHGVSDVVWSSTAPHIATIDQSGNAVAAASGSTFIRAEALGLKDSTVLTVASQTVLGPLRVGSQNRRYFVDPSGRPVYLTGAHYWKNGQDNGTTNPPAAFNNAAYLDFLASNNHNFIRLWMWEQSRWSSEASQSNWFSPTLYVRTGPGTGVDGGLRFDLTRINPAYLSRVRQRVIDAGSRGMYVSVMLFNGWSLEHKGSASGGNPWLGHPYNASNNINGINGDPNGDQSGSEVHTLSIPQVTALQEAYVRAVVDAVNDLDNVLYEISNESNGSSNAWQARMIDLIRSYEATKPKQHPIGMTVAWPNGSNSSLLNSSADWVSMNGDVSNPVVATGAKVSLEDTDHLCGICGDASWPWKSFTRGHNPLLMDGYDGSAGVGDPIYNPSDPKWAAIRRNMGYARSYAQRMDLSRAVPSGSLASSGYCLAVSGSEYLVLLPSGGSVSVNLSSVSGTRAVEWFNPSTGQTTAGAAVTGGATRTLSAPFSGMAVLYIHS
jgi:hypothetical protein